MGKPFWMTLKIEGEGICHAPALRPFDSDKIVAIDRRHRFEQKGVGVGEFLPAGIFYMFAKKLAEKTHGKTTHVRYDDLYDLGRAQTHIAKGEVAEAELMDLSLTEMRATADLICISRGMNAEERMQLQDRLTAQSGNFRSPKRLPGKLRAASHLRKAVQLHEEGNQRNAPAARCAYAAATHVEKRLATLDGMSRFFGRLEFKVWRVIRTQRAIVQRAWIFFAKAPTSEGGGSPERSIPAIRKILPQYIADFEGMLFRPYRDLAKLIAIHLRWLDFELAERDMPAAGKRIAEIILALRRLQLIDRLETNIIGPLAFHLDKPKKRRNDAKFLEGFFPLLVKATDWMQHHHLGESTLLSATAFMNCAYVYLIGEKPKLESAKHELKVASMRLAEVPKFPRAPYPFLQEMADAS